MYTTDEFYDVKNCGTDWDVKTWAAAKCEGAGGRAEELDCPLSKRQCNCSQADPSPPKWKAIGVVPGQEIAAHDWAGIAKASAHAPEGKTPLGMAHGHPPDLPDLYTRGSTTLEQSPVDPRALIHMHQKQRLVLDESASAHIDP
jgi:hypothetical protein